MLPAFSYSVSGYLLLLLGSIQVTVDDNTKTYNLYIYTYVHLTKLQNLSCTRLYFKSLQLFPCHEPKYFDAETEKEIGNTH